MLTYRCDNGFSLTGPNTITCTNARVWSTEPEAIVCVLMTEGDKLCNIIVYYQGRIQRRGHATRPILRIIRLRIELFLELPTKTPTRNL